MLGSMHELSLCEGLVQVIEEQALRERLNRVCGVWLQVGALAGVEVEALRFCFDVVTRGTVAEAAHLEIQAIPGEALCLLCEKQVAVRHFADTCPGCGGALTLVRGQELRITQMEGE